ncbi:MAG: hypothetical protein LV473_12095 [Nitrospira sp.]|nr:hypothetical protein [Nitrospira sp.]
MPRGIGHTVRHSLRSVVWRQRRAVARDLRALDGASTVTEAEAAVERVALTGAAHDPTIRTRWRRDGTRLTVFFD